MVCSLLSSGLLLFSSVLPSMHRGWEWRPLKGNQHAVDAWTLPPGWLQGIDPSWKQVKQRGSSSTQVVCLPWWKIPPWSPCQRKGIDWGWETVRFTQNERKREKEREMSDTDELRNVNCWRQNDDQDEVLWGLQVTRSPLWKGGVRSRWSLILFSEKKIFDWTIRVSQLFVQGVRVQTYWFPEKNTTPLFANLWQGWNSVVCCGKSRDVDWSLMELGAARHPGNTLWTRENSEKLDTGKGITLSSKDLKILSHVPSCRSKRNLNLGKKIWRKGNETIMVLLKTILTFQHESLHSAFQHFSCSCFRSSFADPGNKMQFSIRNTWKALPQALWGGQDIPRILTSYWVRAGGSFCWLPPPLAGRSEVTKLHWSMWLEDTYSAACCYQLPCSRNKMILLRKLFESKTKDT